MSDLTTKAAEIRAGLVADAYVYDPGAGSAMDKLLWARDRALVEADCTRRGGSLAPLYGEAAVASLLALIEQQAAELAEARRLRDYWLYQHDQLVEEVHQLQDAVEGHEAGKALATALARYGFPMSAEAWRNTGDDAPANSQASVEARALHRAAAAFFHEISGANHE